MKAYIVKLTDADNDTTLKLVDQETWDWINLRISGQPKPKQIKNFLGFTKTQTTNRWDDSLCPPSIRERIKKNYLDFDGIWISAGSWENDRAIYAPVLEDDENFYADYANTKTTFDMLRKAEAKGYEVDLDEEYQGVMY